MAPESPHQRRKHSTFLWGAEALLTAALWIVFVGGTQRDEMWVGGGVLFLSVGFLYLVGRMESLQLDLHAADLTQGWRIPWYIVTGIYEMIAILAADILGLERAHSLYRVSRFKRAEPAPRFVARRVLATAFTTTAPNFIVIGIDPEQERMLFHQLKRSSIPKMTRAMGAQPERQK